MTSNHKHIHIWWKKAHYRLTV